MTYSSSHLLGGGGGGGGKEKEKQSERGKGREGQKLTPNFRHRTPFRISRGAANAGRKSINLFRRGGERKEGRRRKKAMAPDVLNLV